MIEGFNFGRTHLNKSTIDLLKLAMSSDSLDTKVEMLYELQFRNPKDPAISESRSELLKSVLASLSNAKGIPKKPYDVALSKLNRTEFKKMGKVAWRDVGVLKASGYIVGVNHGKPKSERYKILDSLVLEDDLSDIDDQDYASEFGAPNTNLRLRKIAQSLSYFIFKFKKNTNFDYENAIRSWQQDLAYLKQKYYGDRSDFSWPKSYEEN